MSFFIAKNPMKRKIKFDKSYLILDIRVREGVLYPLHEVSHREHGL